MTTSYLRLLWTGDYLTGTPLYDATVEAWLGVDPFTAPWPLDGAPC